MKIRCHIKLLGIPLVLILSSQSAQAMDSCLIGNWKADKAQLQQFFTQSSAQVFRNPSGDIKMSLRSNGTGQYQVNNLKLVSNPSSNSGPKISMSMNGSYTFKWSSASNNISLKQHNNKIKTTGWIETAGMKIAIPAVNHNQYGSTGFSSGAYSCRANKLTFNMQGAEKLITVWNKI